MIALREEEVMLPESQCLPGIRLMIENKILPSPIAPAADQ
jgi:hypothetical protein